MLFTFFSHIDEKNVSIAARREGDTAAPVNAATAASAAGGTAQTAGEAARRSLNRSLNRSRFRAIESAGKIDSPYQGIYMTFERWKVTKDRSGRILLWYFPVMESTAKITGQERPAFRSAQRMLRKNGNADRSTADERSCAVFRADRAVLSSRTPPRSIRPERTATPRSPRGRSFAEIRAELQSFVHRSHRERRIL